MRFNHLSFQRAPPNNLTSIKPQKQKPSPNGIGLNFRSQPHYLLPHYNFFIFYAHFAYKPMWVVVHLIFKCLHDKHFVCMMSAKNSHNHLLYMNINNLADMQTMQTCVFSRMRKLECAAPCVFNTASRHYVYVYRYFWLSVLSTCLHEELRDLQKISLEIISCRQIPPPCRQNSSCADKLLTASACCRPFPSPPVS